MDAAVADKAPAESKHNIDLWTPGEDDADSTSGSESETDGTVIGTFSAASTGGSMVVRHDGDDDEPEIQLGLTSKAVQMKMKHPTLSELFIGANYEGSDEDFESPGGTPTNSSSSLTSATFSSTDESHQSTKNWEKREIFGYAKVRRSLGKAWKTGSKRDVDQWRQRRFEICKGCLKYYKKGLKGEFLRGAICLDGAELNFLEGTVAGRKLCFEITDQTYGRSWLMSVEQEGDLNDWKTALGNHIKFCDLFPNKIERPILTGRNEFGKHSYFFVARSNRGKKGNSKKKVNLQFIKEE